MNLLFFFSGTGIGGAETNFLKLGREFHEKGHNISVVALQEEGPLLGYFAPFAKSCGIAGPASNPYKLLSSLSRVIKADKIDVVFNFGIKVELYSRLFSKIFGAEYIVSNIRSTDDWRKWYHSLADRITSFNTDAWVSNSISAKDLFVKREKIDVARTRVIYNYVDESFISAPADARPMGSEMRLGILSNIKKDKGFEDLIPLSQSLDAQGIGHKFIIAGQDKLNGAIQEMVKNNGLDDHFEFRGYISDKHAFFNDIDVFFLPSYMEGLPTCVLESMSLSKPVISTLVGGIPELITNGAEGLLYEPGDIKGFESAIKTMQDKDQRTRLATNASEKVKSTFTKKAVIGKWMDLLAEIESSIRSKK